MRREKIESDSFLRMRRRALRRARDKFEVCGALIRDSDGEIYLLPLDNLATEPAKWEIRRSWLRFIRRNLRGTGERLVGTFHSHVGGYAYPTEKDLDYYPSGFLMMIIDTVDRRVGMWMPIIRHGQGRLLPVAVLCDSPRWDLASATSHAAMLFQKFCRKERRNEPSP
jgi:proteasome lid subunit RPN8/RPN11